MPSTDSFSWEDVKQADGVELTCGRVMFKG